MRDYHMADCDAEQFRSAWSADRIGESRVELMVPLS